MRRRVAGPSPTDVSAGVAAFPGDGVGSLHEAEPLHVAAGTERGHTLLDQTLQNPTHGCSQNQISQMKRGTQTLRDNLF